MYIPSSFTLFGHTIAVEMHNNMQSEKDCVGESDYRAGVLRIQTNVAGSPRLQTEVEQTFFHELIHFIFFYMHEDKLRLNEHIVDSLALLLHQALTTATYEEDELHPLSLFSQRNGL
jgi:hypothetical protein